MLSTKDTMKAEIKRYIDQGYALESATFQVNALHLARHEQAVQQATQEIADEQARAEPKTFAKGQELSTASICDSDCIFKAIVIKRTAKTVTIEQYGREQKRCKIHHDDEGNEYIYPHGRHSMCAIFRA